MQGCSAWATSELQAKLAGEQDKKCRSRYWKGCKCRGWLLERLEVGDQILERLWAYASYQKDTYVCVCVCVYVYMCVCLLGIHLY